MNRVTCAVIGALIIISTKSSSNSKDKKGIDKILQENLPSSCFFEQHKELIAIVGSETGVLFTTRTFLYKEDVPAFIKWLKDNYETPSTDTCIKK